MDRLLKDELLALLGKARAGDATGDDYSRIAAIINSDNSGELIAQVDSFLAQEEPVPSRHVEPYDQDYWQRVFLEMKESWQTRGRLSAVSHPEAKPHRRAVWQRWLAAASILLVLGVGIYFLVNTRSPQPVASSTEILPGKDGAILTLADGSKVLLDSIQNGVVAMQGGTRAKIVDGTLIYEGRGSEVVYNIMSTPKARKFHIILPDGTEAWLNSASSIRYPTTFTGTERRVTVTGEVYFEVAKNEKMPFRLNVNDKAEIEVLGTHFNVKAYENDSLINTTLLEGSIAISVATGQHQQTGLSSQPGKKGRMESREKLILKPGQQAQILVGEKKMQVKAALSAAQNTAGGEAGAGVTVINNTDTAKVMAWKNGVFDFNDITFEDGMHQLERWYDIEVVYEKGIPTDIELNGKLSKDIALNDLVIILEKIGVQCRLEGRKLYIER
ncbi:FecR family protein [Longitalea arenae]|uniref:FecR family protein n=1 Tax=Longitalea arenae TaxID=2812558 RepID=UPI001968836A|nr:FecR family protein [Longitalea arenae]